MIQFTNKPGTNVLAIEPPGDCEFEKVMYSMIVWRMLSNGNTIFTNIPYGQWQYIGTTETMNENECAELIYRDEKQIGSDHDTGMPHIIYSTYVDSLRSAIKAHGGNPDSSVYAVLVNKNEK